MVMVQLEMEHAFASQDQVEIVQVVNKIAIWEDIQAKKEPLDADQRWMSTHLSPFMLACPCQWLRSSLRPESLILATEMTPWRMWSSGQLLGLSIIQLPISRNVDKTLSWKLWSVHQGLQPDAQDDVRKSMPVCMRLP